jgi:azurin
MKGTAAAALPAVPAIPDAIVQLGVVPGEMKFTASELTVQAGQLVEVVFVNADGAPHNFVLGAPGSLQAIGLAADQMAAQPGAAAQHYVPEIAQVIFSTPLVNPGQTLTFQFRAPAAPGQYPYACTFPAHWRIMNGVLNVVAPAGRGRGAGGRGAPAPAGRGQ